jgi:Rrf2 family protein
MRFPLLFSRACEYGLNAMIYVAQNTDGSSTVRVGEVAEALGIPLPSLAKVVQKLTRRGLLVSRRGPGGGIALARSAGEVTLLEVVEAIEERTLDSECVLGNSACSERAFHCPLHDQWKPLRAKVVAMLGGRSIEQIAEAMTENDGAHQSEIRGASTSSDEGPSRPKSREGNRSGR